MKLHIPLWIRVIPIYLATACLIYAPVAMKNLRVAKATAQAARLELTLNKEVSPEFISGTPVEISIPRLGINLKVINGVYDQKNGWNVSSTNAQFATITQKPNNKKGKTVIYGHDNRLVFQPTATIQPGDIAYIKASNGLTFSYKYVSDETVDPTNTTVFNKTDEGTPKLSLITCSGTYFETRRIMNFDYRGVSK